MNEDTTIVSGPEPPPTPTPTTTTSPSKFVHQTRQQSSTVNDNNDSNILQAEVASQKEDNEDEEQYSLQVVPFHAQLASSKLRHVTQISRRAALATKRQIWDSNDASIDVAQSAVDQWEHLYNLLRELLVASAHSAHGLYGAAKAGVSGLENGFLQPLRDWVLLPAFGGMEQVASGSISFFQSEQASNAAKASLDLVKQIPWIGETVMAPALCMGAGALQTTWNVAQSPIPTKAQVRDTVDWMLTGTKWALTTMGTEIVFYVKRADANITRTLSHTQWKVLGSGPYATLDELNQQLVIDHICERYFDLQHDDIARYELAAHIRTHNRLLYHDLVITGLLLQRGRQRRNLFRQDGSVRTGNEKGEDQDENQDDGADDDWLLPAPDYRSLQQSPFLLRHDKTGKYFSSDEKSDDIVFPIWFRLRYRNGIRPGNDEPWVMFKENERRKLEDYYQYTVHREIMSSLDEIDADNKKIKSENNENIEINNIQSSSKLSDNDCRDKQKNEKKEGKEEEVLQTSTAKTTATTTATTPNLTARYEEYQSQNHQQEQHQRYPTIAKWYVPNETRDLLVLQKRHAVSFFTCCPKCQTPHESNHYPPLQLKKYGELCDKCKDEILFVDRFAPPPIKLLMRPTLWRFYGPGDEVRRAVWVLDSPKFGLQPYGNEAQAVLEDAYLFLKWRHDRRQNKITKQSRTTKNLNNDDSDDNDNGMADNDSQNSWARNTLLTVQVPSPDDSELQLVQFTSLKTVTAIKKGLGGAISLFKQRVYRGAYHCQEVQHDDTQKEQQQQQQPTDMASSNEIDKNSKSKAPEEQVKKPRKPKVTITPDLDLQLQLGLDDLTDIATLISTPVKDPTSIIINDESPSTHHHSTQDESYDVVDNANNENEVDKTQENEGSAVVQDIGVDTAVMTSNESNPFPMNHTATSGTSRSIDLVRLLSLEDDKQLSSKSSNDKNASTYQGANSNHVVPQCLSRRAKPLFAYKIKAPDNAKSKTTASILRPVSLDENPDNVDHLVLVVHGIGEMLRSIDLFGLSKLGTIVDCCRHLRRNHQEFLDSQSFRQYKSKSKSNNGRVEYLPVEWHEAFTLQSQRRAGAIIPKSDDATATTTTTSSKVMMSDVSLRTIPQLRQFANDTLMDVLYFMSPEHHDMIIDIVVTEMNFVVEKFRNLTGYGGKISVIGHSLGSVIIWDILGLQNTKDCCAATYDIPDATETPPPPTSSEEDNYQEKSTLSDQKLSHQPTTPQLDFVVENIFAVGSPIAVFLMIRNQRNPLSKDFYLQGCRRVFNIFHPYDPVAYRIEPLIDPHNAEVEPVIMTHCHGGFRFQYQTKRLWKMIVEETWKTQLTVIEALETRLAKLGLLEGTLTSDDDDDDDDDNNNNNNNEYNDVNSNIGLQNVRLVETGQLNRGRRIDYMLQEKEIENANEYLSALAAHSSYWIEKDFSLFVARQICLSAMEKEYVANKK